MLERRPALPPGAVSSVLLGTGVFLAVVAGVGVTVLAGPEGDRPAGRSSGGSIHVRSV